MNGMTDRERMLAAKAAKRFLPAKMEDFMPPPPPEDAPLPRGVFPHGPGFRIWAKDATGKRKFIYFPEKQQAIEAKRKSLEQH